MKVKKESLLLYAVTDRYWLNGRTLYSVVEEALEGGTTFLQLREKNLDSEHFLEEAKELQELCRKYGVPFIVNDNVDVALAMGADGIHVGQHAVLAEQRGADYLGVGAVFPTGSKDDADDVSHETLKAICDAVSIPVVAIGGISQQNVRLLAGSGICGIAVISAIFAQKDIKAATALLKETTMEMLNE